MKEIIFLVEESPEGGFQARALEHSVFTEAETLSDLKAMIKDAVKCHFDGDQGPFIVRMHIVKEETFAA